MVDLDAYFARIAYDGPTTPTLATLRAVQSAHADAIPFEAIDVLLGRGVDLSPAAVDAKLIGAGRGGYCFEQNSLLKRVLTALGFQVQGLLARGLWMLPPGAPPKPRTHMALRVTVDGEDWLADVGFSAVGLPAPLRLAPGVVQPTTHEAYRVTWPGEELLVEVDLGGVWAPLYETPALAQLDVDYETPNWFTATHPASQFRQNLIVGRTGPRVRRTLLNNRLRVRTADGGLDERWLDVEGLAQALREEFALPVTPDWRPVLERAVAAGVPA